MGKITNKTQFSLTRLRMTGDDKVSQWHTVSHTNKTKWSAEAKQSRWQTNSPSVGRRRQSVSPINPPSSDQSTWQSSSPKILLWQSDKDDGITLTNHHTFIDFQVGSSMQEVHCCPQRSHKTNGWANMTFMDDLTSKILFDYYKKWKPSIYSKRLLVSWTIYNVSVGVTADGLPQQRLWNPLVLSNISF